MNILCGLAKTPAIVAVAGLLSASVALAADPPLPPTMPKQLPPLLIEHNIFSNVAPRPPGRVRPSGNTSPIVQRTPAPIFVGAMKVDENFGALLEDVRGNVILARVGDKVAQGTIDDVTLDYLMIKPAEGAAPRRVELGSHIAPDTIVTIPGSGPAEPAPATAGGGESTGTGTPAAASAPATAPAGDATLPPGFVPSGNKVEDEMRLRRLKETGN